MRHGESPWSDHWPVGRRKSCIAYVVKVVRKYRWERTALFKGAVCPNRYFLYINEGPLGGEDDAKSVFDRVNHVPPSRDAAGEKLRQIEEA